MELPDFNALRDVSAEREFVPVLDIERTNSSELINIAATPTSIEGRFFEFSPRDCELLVELDLRQVIGRVELVVD
ncbi:unnamed protein product [Nippostrongylus brasiliensis]|uniref:Chemotaxis protein CheW n=1 Tax=Nippostrongylus brasiliensis TaxID=27835 RepID=A0A0N4XGN5_NIPBR|nr:unnamed protein product [Nippostrongylus brasiliensis]